MAANTAVVFSVEAQLPSVLENYAPAQQGPSVNSIGAAANVGVQFGFSSQPISSGYSFTTGAGGAWGPVAVSFNSSGGSITIGEGVGSRLGGGMIATYSAALPICGR